MHYLIKRPVAWRVADPIRGFHLFDDEELANKHAQWVAPGFPVEGLYVRDGEALVSEWQPINEHTPTGEDDFSFSSVVTIRAMTASRLLFAAVSSKPPGCTCRRITSRWRT